MDEHSGDAGHTLTLVGVAMIRDHCLIKVLADGSYDAKFNQAG